MSPTVHFLPHLRYNHRVIILNRESMPRKRTESDANFPDQNVQRTVTHSELHAHWLIALVRGGGGAGSVSYLSFFYGRSLWAELNGGENSLHWKANMLPLFSIMTLWIKLVYSLMGC